MRVHAPCMVCMSPYIAATRWLTQLKRNLFLFKLNRKFLNFHASAKWTFLRMTCEPSDGSWSELFSWTFFRNEVNFFSQLHMNFFSVASEPFLWMKWTFFNGMNFFSKLFLGMRLSELSRQWYVNLLAWYRPTQRQHHVKQATKDSKGWQGTPWTPIN